MLKRNMKVLTSLAIGLSLSLGAVTVNAAGVSNTSKNTNGKKVEHKLGKDKNDKHIEAINPIYSILKSKLGYTDAQIKEAAKAGKTAFDLAKYKNITADQLKAMIIDEQSKKLDEVVASGKLTKEKADAMKANLKTRMEKWDGKLEAKEFRKGDFNPAYSILKDKLGYTDAQIKEAAKANKTAFDLAKDKNVTADQLRSMIIDEQSKKLDEVVASGKLTKEKADAMKANLKTRMEKWDGKLEAKEFKKGGFNPAYSILKDKLGYTDAQIKEAAKANKTAFDLAKDKNISVDQLKTMIIEEKSKKLDEAVASGKLTKEKADEMKTKLKARMEKWDGKLQAKHDVKNVKKQKNTKAN